MLVYSVGSKQSFDMMTIIRDKILNHLVRLTHSLLCPSTESFGLLTLSSSSQGADWVPMMIVGNKSDLRADQRQVSVEEGKKLADLFKCGFREASAKFNEGVAASFEGMIMEVEKLQNPGEPTGGNKCAVM